ncbi:hypothetical protein QTG54_011230 [Skeletonema marinoi]|uniref:PDZ domain-containing protein n=1 Tax=Skeletonema marinoi TaxID=267567 RepID=A0AAD9D899_9STRA|nr:hypothetical protein QTG54_011230 [Skeletonema marinoi]
MYKNCTGWRSLFSALWNKKHYPRIHYCIRPAKKVGFCSWYLARINDAKKEASLVLAVCPGRLGLTLTLKIDTTSGGAMITEIDPACMFKDKIEVGDRIVTIDNHKITKISDLSVNGDKIRKIGICKKKTLESKVLKTTEELEKMIQKKPNGKLADALKSLVGTLGELLEETALEKQHGARVCSWLRRRKRQ